ncbi:hypothetical protein QYE76_004956 [Lolium multiflorum]|uniref:Uncharacterized protein n=1 Tax=Lolium multiflorum TaxID=4521 RepID=A0AAD8RVJ3_LOLMU|nr:hypothetical protein QYE76_004953 [Lolium multiflorum]KAK1630641.1 hypothetical protein QYE76_004956 [Lolium multiflorum]
MRENSEPTEYAWGPVGDRRCANNNPSATPMCDRKVEPTPEAQARCTERPVHSDIHLASVPPHDRTSGLGSSAVHYSLPVSPSLSQSPTTSLRVSPLLAPPPLLLCRPRRTRTGRGHRHAPRPILTLARFDPPPLLRLKVSDSSDCPPAGTAHHHHRLPRPRDLIGSLASVWREGLFLVRCSAFAVVLSVAATLSWYAQLRARAFVEARLLPAACELLGDHAPHLLRRPARPRLLLRRAARRQDRIRPFASLSRGRVVVDALLSGPTALVAQKDSSHPTAPLHGGGRRHRRRGSTGGGA